MDIATLGGGAVVTQKCAAAALPASRLMGGTDTPLPPHALLYTACTVAPERPNHLNVCLGGAVLETLAGRAGLVISMRDVYFGGDPIEDALVRAPCNHTLGTSIP
jgi:acyl-CoA hydrolase